MNIRERSCSRTPVIQGATEPPSLVQVVYTELKCAVSVRLRGALQIRTGGVRKGLSLQIVFHGLVNIRERSGSHTPVAQGPTGPPSFVQVVYIYSLSVLFRCDLGELYKSVQ